MFLEREGLRGRAVSYTHLDVYKRQALPVLLERDFRRLAVTEGATVEIECVSAPNPESRFTGEWLFYVVSPCLLYTSRCV